MQLFIILFMTFEAAEKPMHEITLFILTDRKPETRITCNG